MVQEFRDKLISDEILERIHIQKFSRDYHSWNRSNVRDPDRMTWLTFWAWQRDISRFDREVSKMMRDVNFSKSRWCVGKSVSVLCCRGAADD